MPVETMCGGQGKHWRPRRAEEWVFSRVPSRIKDDGLGNANESTERDLGFGGAKRGREVVSG